MQYAPTLTIPPQILDCNLYSNHNPKGDVKMTMQKNPRLAWFIIGIIMFFVFGSSLLQLASQPRDIWWTPVDMMLSADDVIEHAQVFINDEALLDVLAEERLKVETEDGMVTLTEEDVGFRMNNYYWIRESQILQIEITVAATTLGLVFLIYGLVPFFVRQPEKDSESE